MAVQNVLNLGAFYRSTDLVAGVHKAEEYFAGRGGFTPASFFNLGRRLQQGAPGQRGSFTISTPSHETITRAPACGLDFSASFANGTLP